MRVDRVVKFGCQSDVLRDRLRVCATFGHAVVAVEGGAS